MTAGDVYTVAGHANGDGGNIGNNGPATAAKLNSSDWRWRVDSNGNLYIADSGNNRIEEVAAANGNHLDLRRERGRRTGRLRGDNGTATARVAQRPQRRRHRRKRQSLYR